MSVETGIPIPFNPYDIPCGWDRADGTTVKLGTPSVSGQIIVTSRNGTGIANLALEEDSDSPIIENAEQTTVTHKFHGNWQDLMTRGLVLHRGIIRQTSDSAFFKLLSCTVQRQSGGRATMTTVEECMSGDTPPDLFECVPVELGLNIIKHPRYVGSFLGTGPTGGHGSATELKNQMVIRLLQDYMENASAPWRNAITKLLADSIGHPDGVASKDGKVTATDPAPKPAEADKTGVWEYPESWRISGTDDAKAAALEIIQKYWRGEESPSVIGLDLSWTEFFWKPTWLNPGGYIEDPITQGHLPVFLWSTEFPPDPADTTKNIFRHMAWVNPQSYSRSGKYDGEVEISWRREADQEVRERTFFGVKHHWIGSPIGHWDPQLYTRYARPSKKEHYIPPVIGGVRQWTYEIPS